MSFMIQSEQNIVICKGAIMKKYIENRAIVSSVIIFCICLVFRLTEYFVLKTDETIFAENFIHKLVGIVILFIVLKILKIKWKDIGFVKNNIFKKIGFGLLLGVVCFGISYSIEYIIQMISNKAPSLNLYVNGFSLTENEIIHTEIYYFVLCILMNIINVIMEEGLFRGLFIKIINNKCSFFVTNSIVALLFGVWHFVMPLKLFISGDMSLVTMIIMMIGYIILSGIMSIKWGLLYKMSGNLWIGIGDHLFNNIVATNILHIVTTTGADELQIVRILIAQLISFITVLIFYKKNAKLQF